MRCGAECCSHEGGGDISSTGLRILIDTNIFIAAESDTERPHTNAEAARKLYSAATKLGHTLCIGSGSLDDIARHRDEAHREKRRGQLARYHVLNRIEIPPGFQSRAGYPPRINEASMVDLTLLLALDRGAAQWLVTEDLRILPHAIALGLDDRVFTLRDALDVLDLQQLRPITVPAVHAVTGYEIDRDDPIFDNFSPDYNIRAWLRDKVAAEARPCLTMPGPDGRLSAVVILKEEIDTNWDLPGRVLKICTFKVAAQARGVKRGELLLWAIIEHARVNGFDSAFVEVFENELEIASLFESFGFERIARTNRSSEVVLGKHLHPPLGCHVPGPLEYNVTYGPGALRPDRFFVVPIVPEWHLSLFPVADDSEQLALYEGLSSHGNAIRKAYVCRSGSKQLRGGDTLLFLRTRVSQMVNVIGVVEATLRSSDPSAILAFTGRRTVYTPTDIARMCANGEVLAIRFRLDRVLDTPLASNELVDHGVMARSPQSIQQVRDREGLSWLRDLLAD